MNEYNAGDVVEAVKDKSVIRGLLVKQGYGYTHDGLGVEGLGWGLDSLSSNGFTITVIEKAAPPLPTEPGRYMDRTGDVWEVPQTGHGMFCLVSPASFGRAHDYAPFTRLESVPVTVEKIAAWVDVSCSRTLASEIRAEFGPKQ